jgi:RNA recognition motif-containing protein
MEEGQITDSSIERREGRDARDRRSVERGRDTRDLRDEIRREMEREGSRDGPREERQWDRDGRGDPRQWHREPNRGGERQWSRQHDSRQQQPNDSRNQWHRGGEQNRRWCGEAREGQEGFGRDARAGRDFSRSDRPHERGGYNRDRYTPSNADMQGSNANFNPSANPNFYSTLVGLNPNANPNANPNPNPNPNANANAIVPTGPNAMHRPSQQQPSVPDTRERVRKTFQVEPPLLNDPRGFRDYMTREPYRHMGNALARDSGVAQTHYHDDEFSVAKEGAAGDQDCRKLFVRQLSEHVSSQQMRELFAPFGDIESADVCSVCLVAVFVSFCF